MGGTYELDPIKKNVTFHMEGPNRRYAIDVYKAATEANPEFSDAYYRLCLVYLVGNDLGKATEAFQSLHTLEPEAGRTKDLLGRIYAQRQDAQRQDARHQETKKN